MNLGGPVWHASVASEHSIVIPQVLETEARRQLTGVGDPALGEWTEFSGYAFHLRRRLSAREQQTVGEVVDVRRTPEAHRRAAQLGDLIRFVPPHLLDLEVGP